MNLDRYLQVRRPLEIGFWLVFFCIIFVSETMVAIMDSYRYGADTNAWEIASWEGTSMIALLMLIPLIVYLDSRIPWRWSNLKVAVPAHVLFSLIFSVLHVGMMVGMRKLIYWLNDSYYDFGSIIEQFFYEYLKDARAYAIILAIIYLYRHLILRLQGEASLLGKSETSNQNDSQSDRILVKKLGREFLIKINDIEHIEAAGNYVNLHINKRVYPLRETLTKIQQRLDDATFKRIHRSHIINLNLVAEIKPLESGDAQVLLSSGRVIPMSRTYRNPFIESL
ncbi:MAG: hypothetical protein ACJAYF_000428 [Arenicella sp.]|jgi:hypothetical protein